MLPLSLKSLSSWRFYHRHLWQFWLSLLSIALGTAVVVAVDLANNSAKRAFALSLEQLTGKATHQIVGAADGFGEATYLQLRKDWRIRKSAPVVEGLVTLKEKTFTLFGVDPFAESMFRADTAEVSRRLMREFLTRQGGVVMSIAASKNLDLEIGDSVQVQIGAQRKMISLLGVFSSDDPGMDSLMVADIATAQELLEKQGKLDRIDLILEPGQEGIESKLPPGLVLRDAGSRNGALLQMTRAFHLNLSALSLLAVVVGSFLVYNTMTFSVLQRRSQYAIQRMLGVTGGQVFQQVLLEALLLGIVGGFCGLIMGTLIGQGLLQLVTRTINDLYFVLSVRELYIHPLLYVKGMLVAVGATLLAAAGPAYEAARIPPAAVQNRSVLEIRTFRWLPRLALAGVVLLIVGLLLSRSAQSSLLLGFFALFLLIIGYSLSIPWITSRILQGLSRLLLRSSWGIRMAVRGVSAGLSRTGLAIAALAVAVSATVGVGMMISSFRASVDDWLGITLQSDVFVSAGGSVSSRADGELEAFWLPRVREIKGVASVSTGRNIKLEINHLPIDTLVLDPGAHSHSGFEILSGNETEAWQLFTAGEGILISEPLAFHQSLTTGQRLSLLSTRSGNIQVPVAGIFRDYSSSQGMLVLPRVLYDRHWNDHSVSTIGMALKEDASESIVQETLEKLAANREVPVLIRSSREIRQRSLEIFDRTFLITEVLRLLALGVAFVGVFSALMALQLERSREYAIYRATGMTPRQMQSMIMVQSGLVGLLAALLAIPLGWLMSEILISVINQRAFGWSMGRELPFSVLLQAVGLSLLAALLAGVIPARKIASIKVAAALRSE